MAHKLLLADDSITIQRVIELTFADEDIDVIVASNGRQAIERAQSDRPDIILADIGMPERDGYQVAEYVRSTPELSNIPVLLLTGAFEPVDEERARTVGSDGVLVKPFEPQMVINRVKELLAGRRGAGRGTSPLRAVSPAGDAARADAGGPRNVTAMPRDPETIAPSEGEAGAGKTPGSSLEDYFDRLDAAFANISASTRRRPDVLELDEDDGGARTTSEGAAEPPSAPVEDPIRGWDPELAGNLTPAPQPHLANAFSAILAEEEGEAEPGALAAILPEAPPAALTDEAIDQIVERVIARMGDESMRRLVIDTAERLVREEIERIKSSSRAR